MQSTETLFDVGEPIDKEAVKLADEFELFWRLYPRKKSRGHAERSFLKARKTAEFQQIMDGLDRYMNEIKKKRTEPDYIKHAGTWLNAKCWLDEPDKKIGPVLTKQVADAEYARKWLKENGLPEVPPI